MSNEHEWDFSSFADEEKFPEQRKELEKNITAFVSKYKDDDSYMTDAAKLKQVLDEYESLMRISTLPEAYMYGLKTSQDTSNPDLRAKEHQIDDFLIKLGNQLLFFELNLGKITKEKQQEFLSNKSLSMYNHYLKGLFETAKYDLSEKEEQLLGLLSSSSHASWVQMLTGFLNEEELTVLNEEGKETKVNYEQAFSLVNHKDKNIRDKAADAINKLVEKFSGVAENEINAILTSKKVEDELRGVDRPDKPRHIADDLDSATVDTMLNVVKKNFSLCHEFYELKAKLLGFDKLAYHERNLEVGKFDKTFTYDKAFALVKETFAGLDQEFASLAQTFHDTGLVDVFPRKGKRGGAFCAGPNVTLPTYIMLNHTDKLRDVLTIAHEFGHGINNELMKQEQNALNYGSPLSTAEVASTFMEDFVLEKVLESCDDEEKLSILMAKLNDDVSTIFRQVACYLFEQELHQTHREKGYLSKEQISNLFQKQMKAYMGDSVDHPDTSKYWWVYWSHIRRFFYVYSYASGLLISKSMQANVKKDPSYVEKVKSFLKAGSSASPKDIFSRLGIDITAESFWNEGILQVRSLLDETKALAKKLGKI